MPEVIPVGNGMFRIVDGTHSRLAYAAANGSSWWVFLDGDVYVIDAARSGAEARARKRTDHHSALSAPMPATVVAIDVAPGEKVAKGDVLIVLEAMKMELPIKAPRDGTVRTIACAQGELVQPGVPLLELE